MEAGRTRRAACAGAVLAALALALPAAAPAYHPIDAGKEPAAYCSDAAADVLGSGHARLGREAPLPAGVRRRRLTVEGVDTVVLEAGPRRARDAVVFVHGFPGSSRDWDDLLAATGRFARALAFDMPGLGAAADAPTQPHSLAGAARFIEQTLAALGAERVRLVLHDFGGPWGLEWARRQPDRLTGAVLLNTGVFVGYHGHPQALVWHTPLTGEADVATTTRERFHQQVQRGNPRPLPAAFVDRMYDDFDHGTRCAALRYYRAIDDPDAMGRAQALALRRRPRPALVIWGKHDPYVPVELAERQRLAFPEARIAIFDDSAHWPFVDNARRVRALVVPFLRPRLTLESVRIRRRVILAGVRVEGAAPAYHVRARLRDLDTGRVLASAPRRTVLGWGWLRLRLPPRLAAGRYQVAVEARGLRTRAFRLPLGPRR